MENEINLGILNGHAAALIFKELMRRALATIRGQRAIFETTQKADRSGDMTDVCTTADTLAQEIYKKGLLESFPTFGIIGEENLHVEPAKGENSYFTVDPLDGTKAFTRRQSTGVGTMFSLVVDGEIISAYVGDVFTNEIYGYRPGSDHVHRITDFNDAERLTHVRPHDPLKSHMLLRDPLDKYSELAQNFVLSNFKSHEVGGGSIGIWMARLWKREVACVIMPPGGGTPWDTTPIVGISQKLGYVFLRPSTIDPGKWEAYEPPLYTGEGDRNHDTLIVHINDMRSVGLGETLDVAA
ncbi:hypothetical protein COB55_00715 [Candidatus Wolfebacteria bacterium]|nr:MAG: hypothetical protein COB55_00715 [Candidatus Wolfebacteria bacterium]